MRKSIILLVSIAPFISADPIITTSVSCQSYGAPRIEAISSCEQGGPLNPFGGSPPYAFASTEVSVTLQTLATDWLTISMKNTVNPVDGAAWLQAHGQLPPTQLYAPAYAAASIAVHIDSFTLGPVRPGILEIQWSPIMAGSYGDFFPSAGFSIDDPLVDGGAFAQGCSGINGTYCYGPGPARPPIPFQLGTSFTFDSFATVWADSMDGVGGGYNGMLVQMRFLEEDGITPVLSYDPPTSVPEPSTLLLGVFSLGLFWRRFANFLRTQPCSMCGTRTHEGVERACDPKTERPVFVCNWCDATRGNRPTALALEGCL